MESHAAEKTLDVQVPHEPELNQDAHLSVDSPSLTVLLPTALAIYLAVFLSSLDRTIVGVAIPSISNQFNSFGDIAWYESAYLLPYCVMQLPLGKIYTFFPAKWVLVACVLLFEIGSTVSASAASSNAFIAGRAISGIGGSGITNGAIVTLTNLVPLPKLPAYQGMLGAVFGLASIIGPLLGGVFTTRLSWRWCFYINLPIGGIATFCLIFITPNTKAAKNMEGTFSEILRQFDPIGNVLLAPGLICLLLALQLGGTTLPWSDHRTIALLVVGPLLLLMFCVEQLWAKDNATVPPRIIRQRSIAVGVLAGSGISCGLVIIAFYLPIYFQAIQSISAIRAGYRLLPYFLSTVVFVIATGFTVSKIGVYAPFLIAGSAVLVVGVAMLTTLRINTDAGEWVGYQIIIGAGMGMALQQPIIAAQTVLEKKDIPIGITTLQFAQFLASTVFVTVSQTILTTTLTSQLAKTLPGFDVSIISNTGATDIRGLVPAAQLNLVLQAYDKGINNIFYCTLGLACLSFIASFFLEWRSVTAQSLSGAATQDADADAEKQEFVEARTPADALAPTTECEEQG